MKLDFNTFRKMGLNIFKPKPAKVPADFASLESERPEFRNARTIWEKKLRPILEEMEQTRLIRLRRAQKGTLAAVLGTALNLIILKIIGIGLSNLTVLILGGLFMSVCGFVWYPLLSMQSATKQHIVGTAAEAFGFSYDTLHGKSPDQKNTGSFNPLGKLKLGGLKRFLTQSSGSGAPCASFDILDNAGLLPSYDDREFEDMIHGHRADASFSMVECELTEERGSGKNRRTVTTFRGLLFHIQYPEPFLGKTLIARQGWLKGWFNKSDLQKVRLVSKELEDNFTIYSDDQVEARTLLSPDRMERLIALERHFKGGKLRGIFEHDHLSLALNTEDQFEAGSIMTTLIDPDRFIETLIEIGLVCDVIDGFLTRHWAKDKLDIA